MSSKSAERWTDREPADFARLRNITDVENYRRRTVTEVGLLAISRDHSRTVERDVAARRFVSIFLTLHPPASGLFRILGIADIHKHENLAAIAGHGGGGVEVLATGISDAMDAECAGLPVRKQLPVHWIADVPDERTLVVCFARMAAPVGGTPLQCGHHDVVVKLHLDGVGVRGAVDKFQELWIGGIGDVQDGPTAVPQMAEKHVPTI